MNKWKFHKNFNFSFVKDKNNKVLTYYFNIFPKLQFQHDSMFNDDEYKETPEIRYYWVGYFWNFTFYASKGKR